ncbi:MAG TPA: thermonuclease family protein, partial [bacterium]|nr:thermonuclease family protein [bacterium]
MIQIPPSFGALVLAALTFGCTGNVHKDLRQLHGHLGGSEARAEAGSARADAALAAAQADPHAIPPGESPNPDDPLDKGWYTYSSTVDGDTIWALPLQESLRLLCIDSEETLKVEEDRGESGAELIDWDATLAAAKADGFKTARLIAREPAKAKGMFANYAQRMRAGSDRPVKFGTPYGDLAEEYARWFFEDQADAWDGADDGSIKVRLEIDDPKRQVDTYGRYLCYVFVKGPDGKDVNYHVEAVRWGMSPYFPKYGHSVRYQREFEEAMAEAKAAKRGIWSDDWGHYTDYDERLAWWYERGDVTSHFQNAHGNDPDYFALGSESEYDRLRTRVGQEAIVYGLIDSIRGRSDPATIVLAHTDDTQFPIDTTNPIAIAVEDKRWAEHYVYARGTVEDHNGTLHLKVTRPEDIWVEPKELGEAYAAGTSKDKGEKEMADDFARPAASGGGGEVTVDKATGLKVVPWQRAEEFENQGEVLVEGTVVAGKIAGKVAFLNFDRDFKTTFSVFVPANALS